MRNEWSAGLRAAGEISECDGGTALFGPRQYPPSDGWDVPALEEKEVGPVQASAAAERKSRVVEAKLAALAPLLRQECFAGWAPAASLALAPQAARRGLQQRMRRKRRFGA